MKTHQIPIEAYLEALKFMGVEDIDLDETQCMEITHIFVILYVQTFNFCIFDL